MKNGQIVMHVLTGESVMVIDVYGSKNPEYKIRTRTYQEVDVKGFELKEIKEEE